MADWDFKNTNTWKDLTTQCTGDLQSPINIDMSKIEENPSSIYNYESAKLFFNYKPSKCHMIIKNRMPIIRFDYGSYIEVSSGLIGTKEGY